MSSNNVRMIYLDSMRGIAAMIVVVAHFLAAFYPYTLFGFSSGYPRSHFWEEWLLWPPFSVFTAGEFAVCLFFVLSGYVLSVPLIGKRGNVKSVMSAIIKRPVRLGGLVAFSVLLASFIWWNNLFFNVDVTKIPKTESSDLVKGVPWFAYYWRGDFSFNSLLNDILHFQAGKKYNPPLWTLYIEFYGSLYVFFVLLLINWFNYPVRTFVLILLFILTYGDYYDGFFFGMLVADAQKQSWTQIKLVGWFRIIVLFSLMFFAGISLFYPFYAAQSFWDSLVAMGLPEARFVTKHISMNGAMVLFLFVILSSSIQKRLEHSFLTNLGKISFALYVLHFLILGSLGAWIVLKFTPFIGYDLAVLISILCSLPILIWFSYWATEHIDKRAIQLSGRFQKITIEGGTAIYRFLEKKIAVNRKKNR